jgi:hypothetical protein
MTGERPESAQTSALPDGEGPLPSPFADFHRGASGIGPLIY